MSFRSWTKKKIVILPLFALLFLGGAFALWYFVFGGFRLSGKDDLAARITEVSAPGDSYVGKEKIEPKPVRACFSFPVAKLDQVYARPDGDIAIYPAIKGEWYWESASCLRFMPEKDWIPGLKYEVSLPGKIFNPQVKVKDKEFSFSSPVFKGVVEKAEFYEDPRNKDKEAVASFRFNYPLDAESLKDKISVESVNGVRYGFTYKLSDLNTVLHVISAPLKIQNEENFVKITVFDVGNAYNKKTFPEKITATVKVPSSSTFFNVKSVSAQIIRNEQNNGQPEQILAVNFTTAVNNRDLERNFNLYYAADNCFNLKKRLSASKDATAQLRKLRHVLVKEAPSAEGNGRSHLLQFDLRRQKGCLVAEFGKELNAVEGYNLGKNVIAYADFVPYPKEVKIAADGAILSLKGSKELPFLSRGVDELRISAARIDASDINHLATQTGGDFAHPYFKNYYFSEDNISEVFEKVLKINSRHPAEANYSSISLGEYFKEKKGIFLVSVRGYAGKDNFGGEDRRLVVITDLGIIVKDNLDNSHEVFIASISEGKPAAGALVEVLGKNGLPVLSAKTNETGKAYLPDFSNFKNDKEAAVYKVSLNNDVSFLPIGRGDRRLNLSRFDVGGEYDYEGDEYNLKGYIFSDRGIYRPGEEAHFGLIVRQRDLNVPQNMPFVVEVRNPRGDVAAVQNIRADEAGLMEYGFKTPVTALTGNYQLYLYVKDKNNSRRYVADVGFKVEEFQPDSMKIKASWAHKQDKGWDINKTAEADVFLANLYGNPAAGHKLKASYALTPASFRFEEFQGFVFTDPLRQAQKTLRPYKDELSAQTTNAEGKGRFTLDLSQFEQGTYQLRLSVEGLELGGGRGVGTSLGRLVSPNASLIGWKANGRLDFIDKDALRAVDFIAINNLLEQISLEKLSLSLLRRQYISSLLEMPDGTYRYQMVPKEQLVSNRQWAIGQQGARLDLKTDEAGEYILQVADGDGRILARIEYNVAGAANLSHAVDKDASLGLKLDKETYKSGEEITMQITAPYAGYGLITIERDSVYAYKWFKADTTSLVQSIKLPDYVEGNAYVNVAFFRDIDSKEIYMPALSYAAAPFSINKDKRAVDIRLDVPETVKPGDVLKIGYATSEKANIIVYGANQGILQVARYVRPNPLEAFLKKRALRVVTSQIMDLIMPDIRILRMLSSSGGDSSLDAGILEGNLNPFARKTDKPVAFWSGIMPGNSDGGIYEYKVPEFFNGEIKVMAVAVSTGRFGSAAKSVLSRGDFVLTPSGPLAVAPGDEFVIGLGLSNLVKGAGDDYEVSVSLDAGDGFEIIGASVQKVKLAEGKETLLNFKLKALAKPGAREIKFTAESSGNPAQRASMPYSLSLRPSVPYGGEYAMGYEKSRYILPKAEDLYDFQRVQQLSASPSPLVLVSGLLKYLDKFPHGCTEQTVSKVFPAMEVFFKYPELVKGIDIYGLFDDALMKLRQRQQLDGGFDAWGVSGAEAHPFASVYAAHFLVRAKELGFDVSENMLEKAVSYLEKAAGNAPADELDIVPAYAAYVLTLNGKITTNYLLNLETYYQSNFPKTWRNRLGALFMAASYKLLQDDVKARSLSGRYQKADGEGFERQAMDIYLRALYFPDLFDEEKDVKKLLKFLGNGNFTTNSAAFSILALNAFQPEGAEGQIRFSQFSPELTPFPHVGFNPQTEKLEVSSDKPFYYTVVQQGFGKAREISPKAEGLEVYKSYYDKDGNKVDSAKLGNELNVKIRYRGLRKDAFGDVAIVDLLPGCMEVVSGSVSGGNGAEKVDVREDRVVAYVWASPETEEINYKVKVTAQGSFTVPAVFGSALYLPLVRANSASGLMLVRD